MSENNEAFLKGLAELRELALKGSEADLKKFNALSKSLLLEVRSRFVLPIVAPMASEHENFIKVLATFETGYWQGYGVALMDFLLPLLHSLEQTGQLQKQVDQVTIKPTAETKPSDQVAAVSEAKDSNGVKFIMD